MKGIDERSIKISRPSRIVISLNCLSKEISANLFKTPALAYV